MGAQFTVLFLKADHADLIKRVNPDPTTTHKQVWICNIFDVETNPDPTTTHKQVWICNICHKQIHCMKQISIRCNRIEHWVHLRCTGFRQDQYTDTWACHLHRESGLRTHIDITSPHHSIPWSKPLPTPHLLHPHHRNPNTDTRQTLPLFPQNW